MARGQSWADEKNRQSVLKQKAKTRKLDKTYRDERREDFRGRLGSDPASYTPERVRQVLRAVVEGDANDRTPRLQQITDEISHLKGRLVDVDTGLTLNQAKYDAALGEREEHLKQERAWNDHGRRGKGPSSAGSHRTVWALTALLIVLEGVLLTPPAEEIARLLFPSLEDATVVALLGVAALVGIGAAAVIAAAREAKTYSTLSANARVVGAAAHDDQPVLFEAPSPFMARAMIAAAAFIQLLMMVLRLQYETGDSSGRSILILLSVIVAAQAAMIGLLEYRRYEASTAMPTTYDQGALDLHSALNAQKHDLERAINALEVERNTVHLGELRELQRFAGELDLPNVLEGINNLVDDYEDKAAALRDAAPAFEPLDMQPAATDVPPQRTAPAGDDPAAGRTAPNGVPSSVTLP